MSVEPPRFARRRYFRLLAGEILRSPFLLALTAVAIGGIIGLVISAVISHGH